jgi:DNA-binding NarL/FixJ family response regulator
MSVKVLLADDHAIVIEGLRAVLSAYEDIDVCGEANNGQEVLDFLSSHYVDIVVLDINMPIMDGLTCARRIREKHSNVKIIVLTMYAQKSFIEEMLKIGIDGSLLKSNTGKELKEAIYRVHSGKSYYDLIHTFNDENNSVTQYKLGERELEIIKLLAEGLTSQQIAEKLFIAESTVKTHRRNILRKTELNNTSQLIQFALNQKII